LRDAGVAQREDEAAAVTIRTTDDQTSGSDIEMSIGPDDIGIQLRSVPTRGEWEIMIQLVDSLLGNLDADRSP
jgi:hypothetical protein